MTGAHISPEDFLATLGVSVVVTYIRPGTYRTWLREGETVLTEIVGRKGVTAFMKRHGLDIFDIRKEPKEWNM